MSTYNVAPQQAGYYFNKIQCFCFEEQKLRPGVFTFLERLMTQMPHTCIRFCQRAKFTQKYALIYASDESLSRSLFWCAGEKIDMPVFFYIDPEFATDDRLKSINHLTLSYTFFNVDEEEVDLDGEVVLASSLIGRERASTAQTAAAG